MSELTIGSLRRGRACAASAFAIAGRIRSHERHNRRARQGVAEAIAHRLTEHIPLLVIVVPGEIGLLTASAHAEAR